MSAINGINESNGESAPSLIRKRSIGAWMGVI